MNDYITIRDIANVTPTITKINVIARADSTRYLHQWLIGDYPENLPRKLFWDEHTGKLSVIRTNINVHHEPTRYGPEMGWALKESAIHSALLNAPITHLSMNCADGITYELSIDITLTELEVEMIRAEFDAEATT
ncbi:MAG: hypothetical protein IJ751_03615 [Oscillospiraceae bacterium]|nr:hypothetical protein [Oscillospiraceae bacterium]